MMLGKVHNQTRGFGRGDPSTEIVHLELAVAFCCCCCCWLVGCFRGSALSVTADWLVH